VTGGQQPPVAATLGVTSARVTQILGKQRKRWQDIPVVGSVRTQIIELLCDGGRVMGVGELAAALLGSRGSVRTGDGLRGAVALAAVRAAVEASYVVTVKNPRAPSPPGVGLRDPGRATLPADLQGRFRDRRFAPLDPPGFLDQRGVEILLIGAAHDASAELGVNLDAEVERAARNTIFEDLLIGRAQSGRQNRCSPASELTL
jgi:hypothetical protein